MAVFSKVACRVQKGFLKSPLTDNKKNPKAVKQRLTHACQPICCPINSAPI